MEQDQNPITKTNTDQEILQQDPPRAAKKQMQKPRLFLLVHNIQKPKNLGMMIRSCAAFNTEKVFLISKNPEKKKEKKIMKAFGIRLGSQGTDKKMDYHIFYSIQEAKEYFNQRNITICGIEITETSQSINADPWRGDTVLVPGNEGHGLMDSLKEICDQFVYIPQYTEKTASLNVAIATSICLQRFSAWAGYKEAPIYGEKFLDPEQEKVKYEERVAMLKKRALEKKKAEEGGARNGDGGEAQADQKKVKDK